MADARDPTDEAERARLELGVEPTVAGRVARWVEHGRTLRGRADAARARHPSVDLGFNLVERDSSIGGGLLAGALAYRLFVLLLPTSLLLISALGIYAGTVDKKPSTVAREAGLHGLIGREVAQTAGGGARAAVFVLMIPALLYSLVALHRAIARVHAIAWEGSARGVRITAIGVATLGGALLLQIAIGEIIDWIGRGHEYRELVALLAYVVVLGGAWFAVSLQLPHGNARWTALGPGALLFGVGLLFVNAFNIYVTARLVQSRADTYGALGIAAALLFSLVLIGRLIVVAAELNASLSEHRANGRTAQR